MSRLFNAVAVASLIASLGACAGPNSPTCAPGTGVPMAVFTLFFGEAIHGRPDLTGGEWQTFLDNTVTAALPDGYTVLDGNGAWMSPITHNTVKESTKILIAAVPDTSDSLAAIDRIRSAYQTEFHQQLVGMTKQQACATF
jgi:hypothetical protein